MTAVVYHWYFDGIQPVICAVGPVICALVCGEISAAPTPRGAARRRRGRTHAAETLAQLSLSTVVVLLTFGFFLGLLYGTASSRTEVRPVAVVSASDKMYAERFTKATKQTADGPFLLIGVISSPTAFGRRRILRRFATASASPTRPVQTEFVFGNSLYSGDMPADDQQRLADEANAHGDAIFVNARERLPHVGKAAEKSAGWWLTAPKRSGASFFCKTDDDSLIHHEHLTAALAAAAKDAKSPNIIFSYIRWRGWLPGNRFQACGGGWGGPIDAIRHIEDPSTIANTRAPFRKVPDSSHASAAARVANSVNLTPSSEL